MAGVSSCMKYSMFFFNFLFWVAGCIILGVSIWLRVNKNNQIVSSDIPAVNLLIAIGSIIMVLGFLGCCGAIRESRCMLLLFFIGLLLIFLLLVAAGIVGIVYKSKVEDGVKEALKGYVPITSQTEDIQNAMNSLQSEAKCCGIFNGASDWGNAVPDSCKCQLPNNCTTSGTTTVYKLTCGDYIIQQMQNNMIIVLGVAFGLAILMVGMPGLIHFVGWGFAVSCHLRHIINFPSNLKSGKNYFADVMFFRSLGSMLTSLPKLKSLTSHSICHFITGGAGILGTSF
ncbi:tetraspanin-8-like [Polypterus senegalus]|uniref:tetraspanin-8-like n=1 Tax=Polypterus senegalus TaxID=55291 RepID=UPI001965D7D8|nr:tetraspanin-8-like [Polypterus senegalus]